MAREGSWPAVSWDWCRKHPRRTRPRHAFVRSHPAVTSVLIGPRTPEQLDDLLAGAGVQLGEDVLDRIDEIVPPGTEINPADNYQAAPPALLDKRLRRR